MVVATPEAKQQFLLAEYAALAEYYGKIITFRFTTAAFFVAAVALVLQAQERQANYVLLLAVSLGIWLVELRNRAIFHSLLRRAWRIERAFLPDELPLFTHMAPLEAAKELPDIKPAQHTDRTRVFLSERFPLPIATHTVGFDILYLSVMAYAIWSLRSSIAGVIVARTTLDPVLALFAFLLIWVGYLAVRSTEDGKQSAASDTDNQGLSASSSAVPKWVVYIMDRVSLARVMGALVILFAMLIVILKGWHD